MFYLWIQDCLSAHTNTVCDFAIYCSYTKLLAALVLGQALSALLCGTGVSSQLLFSKHSIEVPTTQAFLNYLLLGFVYGVPMAMKKDFWSILRKNWWKYVFLGLVDVEANYLIILAYKYTNLTTIQVRRVKIFHKNPPLLSLSLSLLLL